MNSLNDFMASNGVALRFEEIPKIHLNSLKTY